ncbi:MAG: efflux RND transporter periplasmic adaptor subunit [Dongiaceae bacterium]
MIKTSYFIAASVAIAAAAWVLSGQLDSKQPVTEAASAMSDAATEAALPQVRVRRQTAEPRAVEIVLRGRTDAVRSVEVRAETKGRVAEVFARKGALVQEGDILARLADDDRQARLRQAKALLAQREIEYDNAKKLSAKGYRAETDVADAMAKLEEAKADVASMEIDIRYTTIRAPFRGVVELRPVEIGDFLNIGDPVATIVDLDPILVVGQVSERDIDKVKSGMTGNALLATGETVKGSVRFVSAAADEQTRTFRVELEVPNPDRHIVQGVSSELRLPVADLPAHRVSPAILTLADNGDIGVKILGPDSVVEFQPVTILADGPDGVWLTGLPATVTFITVGQDFVGIGQKVEPVPETGDPAS